MDQYEIIQTLATHPRFIIFEAFSKKLQLLVILKKCEFSDDAEAELFIRSALIKTRDNAYLQPLLSIFIDLDQVTKKFFLMLVWKKGNTLDNEVEQDQESLFPSGNAGYGKPKQIYIHPHTKESVEKALCLILGEKIIRKVSKKSHIQDLNSTFKEALAHAKCKHPNILMERLKHDLSTEIEERKSEPYEETELQAIMQSVTAGLLHAKTLNLAYRDIKPANILRGPKGLKLADFGSTWLKGKVSQTSSAAGTEVYMSPEALDTLGNPDLLYRPFESDVFSLGMTMLHLASLKLPPRTKRMNDRELEEMINREVHALSYSAEFKGLLLAMLAISPLDRPSLESIAQFYTLKEHADRYFEEGDSKYYYGDYNVAAENYATADAIYSRISSYKDTASNLMSWGNALKQMGKNQEAVVKYAAAHAIHSRLPSSKDTANNLHNWGVSLRAMGKRRGAMSKHAEAHAIYSQFPSDKDTADNLMYWGNSLSEAGKNEEAVAKYTAAHDIYSQLPNEKDTADSLINWGNSLKRSGTNRMTAVKHAAARAIRSLFLNEESAASNLSRWGNTLCRMGRKEEAIMRYEAAHAIYVSLGEITDAEECERAIAKLR